MSFGCKGLVWTILNPLLCSLTFGLKGCWRWWNLWGEGREACGGLFCMVCSADLGWEGWKTVPLQFNRRIKPEGGDTVISSGI
jgi:hypothetical protein